MNKNYYYEIQQKTKDFEQKFHDSNEENFRFEQNSQLHNEENSSEKIIATTTTKNVRENLLNDYEIISNDEFENENGEKEEEEEANESDEIIDLTKRNQYRKNSFENPLMSTRFMAFNTDSTNKLQLNLNASKISLKNDKTKLPTKTQKALKMSQHIQPFSFTIQPLKNKPATTNYLDEAGNDSNVLPEIVLTSFEMRENATTTSTSTTSASTRHTMKKSATVTFQTTPTPTPTVITPNQKVKTSVNDELSYFAKNLTLLPLSTTSSTGVDANLRHNNLKLNNNNNNNKNINTNTTEIYNKFRQDSEDSSEINSQLGGGGNSTSPESLMDNILSAASSVSVCESSTNSSAATEVRGANETLEFNDYNGGGKRQTLIQMKPIEGMSVGQVFNSSLNSKSKSYEFQQKELQQKQQQQQQMSSPSILKTMPTTTITSTVTTPVLSWLQPPIEQSETANVLRSRTPSPSPSIRIMPERALYPDELKCQICGEPFRDPRTLNCLHSFCFQCLVNENFKQDQSIPFWSQPNEGNNTNTLPTMANVGENEWKSSVKSNYSFRSLSPDTTVRSFTENVSSPSKQRHGSFSFRRKKSQDRIFRISKTKSDGRASDNSSTMPTSTLQSEMEKELNKEVDNVRFILCKICNFSTELPIGGLRQLPQNFILVRKIEELQLKMGDEVISKVFCSLCFEETNATYHCIACTLNLCTLCKDAHERQKSTANHKIKNIMELRRARKQQQNMLDDYAKFTLKCGMHPGFEIKSFCTVCLQVACTDCLVLLHKGHKHENISKAFGNYIKILNSSIEQSRPLCNYAEHSIERLSSISKDINRRCDEIQASVENFMQQYFEALEVHRKTLLQQVSRARDAKIEMVIEQQLDLEKRSADTTEAVKFTQELRELASEVEVLSFVNILLKRFEYCQQFKPLVDPKISEFLHFLPKIVAPSTKEQNDITLYGIITMQTVEPGHCTLQMEGFSQLRLHKRVELTILTRDSDGVSLCHGGMLNQIQAQIKYKEGSSKSLPIELSDNRDGTYCIAFTPDAQGILLLTININDKAIKGSPFSFQARAVRPHNGIYHCCSFCSSTKGKNNKTVKCSCDGQMPGFDGCGHGHAGHPGRRHWSCCGNVLENSECNVANKLLNNP